MLASSQPHVCWLAQLTQKCPASPAGEIWLGRPDPQLLQGLPEAGNMVVSEAVLQPTARPPKFSPTRQPQDRGFIFLTYTMFQASG